MGNGDVNHRLSFIFETTRKCETFIAFNRSLFVVETKNARLKYAPIIHMCKEAFSLQFIISLSVLWDSRKYEYSLRGLVAYAEKTELHPKQKSILVDLKRQIEAIERSGIIKRLLANRSEGFAHPLLESDQRKNSGAEFTLPTLEEYKNLLSQTVEIVETLHRLWGFNVDGKLKLEETKFKEFDRVFRALN